MLFGSNVGSFAPGEIPIHRSLKFGVSKHMYEYCETLDARAVCACHPHRIAAAMKKGNILVNKKQKLIPRPDSGVYSGARCTAAARMRRVGRTGQDTGWRRNERLKKMVWPIFFLKKKFPLGLLRKKTKMKF